MGGDGGHPEAPSAHSSVPTGAPGLASLSAFRSLDFRERLWLLPVWNAEERGCDVSLKRDRRLLVLWSSGLRNLGTCPYFFMRVIRIPKSSVSDAGDAGTTLPKLSLFTVQQNTKGSRGRRCLYPNRAQGHGSHGAYIRCDKKKANING